MAFAARNNQYTRMRARGALGGDNSEWVPSEIAQAMAEDDAGSTGMFDYGDQPNLHLEDGIFEDQQALPGYALRERGDGPSEVIDAQTGTPTRVFLPGWVDGQVDMPSGAPRYPIQEGYMLADPRSLMSEDSGVGIDPTYEAGLIANDVPASLGDIPFKRMRTKRYIQPPEERVGFIGTRYRSPLNAGRGGTIGYQDIYLPGQGVLPVQGLGEDVGGTVDSGGGATPMWQYAAAGVALGIALAVFLEMRGGH